MTSIIIIKLISIYHDNILPSSSGFSPFFIRAHYFESWEDFELSFRPDVQLWT